MGNDTKIYSAIDLLDKIFEFTEMTPNPNEWNLKSLKSNPPRHIRFLQIQSLLNAFCVVNSNQSLLEKAKARFFDNPKISIDSFLRGDFIKNHTITEYTHLIQFIKEFTKSNDHLSEQQKEIRLEQLMFIFPQLVDFKRKIRALLTFNSGWLEASSLTSQFSIYLTDSISKNLVGKYGEFDRVLEMFINPTGLKFTQIELIERFGFPSENLDDIDMDFT